MSNQKNEWDFQDNATKKEFRVLYDVLKRAKLPLSTEHNAVYGLDDTVLVLLYMCKNCITANRAVTELGITFRDDRSGSIPTVQWLLGMIDAMDPDKMDALCRRMLKSTIKDGSGLERKTGHMLAIDKHLIPFTGANRHNDRLVISGKPKGGISRFETYATMQVGDSPMHVPLLDESLEVVTRTCRTQDSGARPADAGCCLYGDATYASRDNVTACRDRGAESRIKLGVNSSGRGKGTGDAWGMAVREQLGGSTDSHVWKVSNDEKKRLREEWKKKAWYGKRWLVEIVFSAFKRMFGEHLY